MAGVDPVIAISSSEPVQNSGDNPHRLATQSAAAALQLADNGHVKASALSTGLASLDSLLGGGAPPGHAGFQRGKTAEVWGPIGSGRTSLAYQVASLAVEADESVLWIDTGTSLSISRLRLLASKGDSFHYLSIPTLSHLLALTLHPPSSFVPNKTALLVIDDLNTIIDLDYPRLPFNTSNRTEQQKWQAGRRYAILGSLVTALNRLAATHDLAVIVTTGCSSRMRSDTGQAAALAPGLGGSEWESGVHSRIVLFRDLHGRFLGVQKCQGRNLTPLDPVGDIRSVIGFDVSTDGALEENIIDLTSSSSAVATTVLPNTTSTSPARAVRKRNYDEIADSDDDADEFEWANADVINIAEVPAQSVTAAGEAQDPS